MELLQINGDPLGDPAYILDQADIYFDLETISKALSPNYLNNNNVSRTQCLSTKACLMLIGTPCRGGLRSKKRCH